jgi:hypothetical protein
MQFPMRRAPGYRYGYPNIRLENDMDMPPQCPLSGAGGPHKIVWLPVQLSVALGDSQRAQASAAARTAGATAGFGIIDRAMRSKSILI